MYYCWPIRAFLSLYLTLLTHEVSSLSQNFINFYSAMQEEKSPNSLMVLFKLNKMDTDLMAVLARKPVIVISDHIEDQKNKFIEILSARRARSVIVFADSNVMDMSELSFLLRYTKHKTIFMFGSSRSDKITYINLKQDVVSLKDIGRGDLLLSSFCLKTMDKNIWYGSTKQLLISDRTYSPEKSCSSSLKNQDVRVSTTMNRPSVIYLPHHRYAGAEVDLFQLISKSVGFNYQVKEDAVAIERDQITKKWLGVTGDVINGTSQFGIGSLPIYRPEDASTFPVDFSPVTFTVEIVLLSVKPKPLKSWGNFLRPFDPSLWVGLFGALLICSVAAWMLLQFRISFWYTIYNFTSTLWGQNKNLYMPLATSMVEDYRYSTSPAKRVLYERAVERHTIYKLNHGVIPQDVEQRLIQEGGARITVKAKTSMLLMAAERRLGYQPFRVGKNILETDHGGIAIQMYQPWIEEFNRVVMHTTEAGIVDHLYRKYIPINKYSYGASCEDTANTLEAYKVEHLAGPLIVLAIGVAVASWAAGLEQAVGKFTQFNFEFDDI